MSIPFDQLWRAHTSNRLDPKYHLFKREEAHVAPDGWMRKPIRDVLRRRLNKIKFEGQEDELFQVMTISQTGEIRPRMAGKGLNPPEWRGAYFQDSPGDWFAARQGDVVFSSIDLWKGCIAFVPKEFDHAVVSKEFPIYEVVDDRLSPAFLQVLLRSRYYQRAFRAITTGHSNRRRTQEGDFEALEITFPASRQKQEELIQDILGARDAAKSASGVARVRIREKRCHPERSEGSSPWP